MPHLHRDQPIGARDGLEHRARTSISEIDDNAQARARWPPESGQWSGLEPTADERRRLLEEHELGRLERWLAAAGSCADVASLLAVP